MQLPRTLFLIPLFVLLSACNRTQVEQKPISYVVEENIEKNILNLNVSPSIGQGNSQYYASLAKGYLKQGDLEKSWDYARKALNSTQPVPEAFFVFSEVFAFICPGYRIHSGMTEEELVEKLGVPDKVILADCEEKKALIYGLGLFYIRDNLVSEAFIRGNPNLWEPFPLSEP